MRSLASPKVPILVVDDRSADRLAVETSLASPLYELVSASSGKEALRRVLERDFAVILLDVVLPDMDGFEVAAILKQRERSRDTPIIFLTALGADMSQVYRGYSVGAVDYLVKPIEVGVLKAKVAIFADLHRKDLRIKEQAEALIEADRRARAQELDELKQASEKRYRDLAEAILPVVWTAGPDGAVTYFNRRWTEYTGLAEEASLGWGWMAALHPDDSRAREESWREATASEGIYRAECRLLGRDGAYRWYICRAVPERGAAGRVVGWIGSYTDCDDLKRAHAAAEDARRRSELLAEVSAVLGSTSDDRAALEAAARFTVGRFADGCVVELAPEVEDGRDGELPEAGEPLLVAHVDPAIHARLVDLRRRWGERGWFCDLRGTRRFELLRKVTDDALRALAHDEVQARLLRELGLESAIGVPLLVRGQALGSLTFLSTSAGRHYAEPDLGMALDLAHRAAIAVDNARLYRGARRAVGVRDEFLSIASHELRTPLTSLQLQLQMLQRQLAAGNATQARDKIDKAVRQTRRLEKLIANLLDVSRILAGRVTLELEEVDLVQTAREVVERFAEDAAHAECALRVEPRAEVVGTWDRVRVEQVLTNLVANALKYAPGSPVVVEIDGAPGKAVVRVSDRGAGVPKEHRGRIFERFERAADGQHRGGLGLGLYIARHIVEAHGGTIAVESAPGGGASFVVELPTARLTRVQVV